jgi:hypothetical protein
MTQSPHSGPAAPLTTEFGSESAVRNPQDTGTGFEHSNGATAASSTTPWGSTSTAAGVTGAGSAAPQSAAMWGAAPPSQSHADAPTASVPLVQDTIPAREPGRGTPSTGRGGRGVRGRGPRRARLQLRHINPWTVLKFSCVLSIALFFVWLIVIGVLFGVLDGAGIIAKINDAYTTIQGSNAKAPVTASVVFGGAAIIGVANIVRFIALSTVGSVVYNLCADLVGGIEVTLSER